MSWAVIKKSPVSKVKAKVEKPVSSPVVMEEAVEKTILPETVNSVQDDRDGSSDTEMPETENKKEGTNGVLM